MPSIAEVNFLLCKRQIWSEYRMKAELTLRDQSSDMLQFLELFIVDIQFIVYSINDGLRTNMAVTLDIITRDIFACVLEMCRVSCL